MATMTTDKRKSGWAGVAAFVWVVLAVLGIQGLLGRLLQGHHLANYGSYVTWGLWVAAYIYFIGLSAGAFLLSSLIYVAGMKRFEKIGVLALFVSAITLVMALLSIWFDLGHMGRFYYIYIRPNFGSMMAWMVWLYTAYFLLVLTELWLALRPGLVRQAGEEGFKGKLARLLLFGKTSVTEQQLAAGKRWLKILGGIGVPLAISFHGGVGALFATVVARPYWHTPLYPILFLTGALASGGALLAAVVAFLWPKKDEEWASIVTGIGRIVLGILLFDLLLEWAEFSIAMWYSVGPEYELMMRVLFGEYWYVFWVFHILLGSLIPIYLFVRKGNNPIAVGVGGLLAAVTFMAVRLNIVVPALVEPQLRGLEWSYRDDRLLFEYLPSWFEWQVVFFVVALGIAIFYVGYRWLPIVRTSEEA
ncbi:MAG: hypothetical protein D6724_09955 [Armatimonadetes bacterium]|nr:MAG: hypothetical protein D6724_09955 [Armatimonadota bacterium]